VSKTVLIMVLVGAFATAVIIAGDGVFAEDIQTKLTKKSIIQGIQFLIK